MPRESPGEPLTWELPDPGACLVPAPRHLEVLAGAWKLPARVEIRLDGQLEREAPGLERIVRAFAALAREVAFVEGSGPADFRLERASGLPDEGYHLEVNDAGVLLRARTKAGFHYGLCTLAQWLRSLEWSGERAAVPGLRIDDEPDFSERGFTVDVARGKRPSLETLFELVERLASWKYNRLQLYMEADFAFSDSEQALQGRSPYTAKEIGELDAHCRAHHIELVPNQQSLGHMHAWLRHERWRDLAEVPTGVEHPFSRVNEPFSLAAGADDSIAFLDRLYSELLPCFSSGTVNVGLDETFDLGQGRSAAACARRGKERVYLEHLQAVHRLAAEHGKRIQFWGDIVIEHPQVIADLPPDATAMVWGYEADFPFEERLPAFAACGLAFQVCPGTSSWNSFGGRVTNALGNLKKAAIEAKQHGAHGLLITDWGDRGHLQPLPICLLGYLCGAAFAWNVAQTSCMDMQRARDLLDRHAFEDRGGVLGGATIELGRVTDVLGDDCENGHALFFATTFAHLPFPHPRIVGLEERGLDAVREHLAGVLDDLAGARSDRPDAALLAAELRLARDQLCAAEALCRARLELPGENSLGHIPASTRADLRNQLDSLCRNYRDVWHARNRPGGLEESLAWLDFLG